MVFTRREGVGSTCKGVVDRAGFVSSIVTKRKLLRLVVTKESGFRYKRNFERTVLKALKFTGMIASYCRPFIPTALTNQVIIRINKGTGC
jgi:hypothetical protein